ncbi:MAG: molybdopterin dehydrogenase FAD-binding protein [Chloroflexi bacterium]|nr:molybdopterin dehydrogenase FAD-binding protein [Chloroflexota bacterium]
MGFIAVALPLEVRGMIPATFEYLAPQALPEAIALLEEHGADAKILAGGHPLIPLMKLRLAAPAYLKDINYIAGLKAIREADGLLRIGALVRDADLEESELLRKRCAGPVEASRTLADPLVLNLATVGGNLVHADPANDHPAVMPALNAALVATGPAGTRTIPLFLLLRLPEPIRA